MVNKPLIRTYFLGGGGTLGRGRLTSHDTYSITNLQFTNHLGSDGSVHNILFHVLSTGSWYMRYYNH